MKCGVCHCVTLVNPNVHLKTQRSGDSTHNLTNQGGGRQSTPIFCKVKVLFLPEESGRRESDIYLIYIYNDSLENVAWWQGKPVKIF